jgi:hypothetical protein
MNAQEIEHSEEAYNLYLSNIFMNISIANQVYPPGEVFKKVDPERYQKEFYDWAERNRAWECSECGTESENEDEAEECCQNFQCAECSEWYVDQEDARECCQNYKCEKCEEWHQQESDADMCCKDYWCTGCDEGYYTEEEANKCCFACSNCGTKYIDEEERSNCCLTSPHY